MKLKSVLKTLGASIAILALVFVGLGVWGLSKLPSIFEIRQGLTPPALKKTAAKTSTTSPLSAIDESQNKITSTPAKIENVPDQPRSSQEALADDTAKVLLEDFTDSRKPLIETCHNLEKASDSHLLRDPTNANAKTFFHSLAQGEKDPLVESAAPILRYVFRAPGMSAAVDMIMKSEEQNDPSLLKKAEFYYEIYRAGGFLKENTRAMDDILQKSYNLHYLARAVAQKPELARDSATRTFCEQMEKTINQGDSYNADEAAKEMQNFFESAGIDAKKLGYDPLYRSKVNMNVSNSQVRLNDAWVLRLFARDIEKAQQDPTQN
ncbi:hypothetical protein ACLWBD_09605 [Bdellovibrio sp. HCB117]|uniref:hypothetical protein n=1 Tax=Bdellovibrio sp. HCB117 TaxID=3394359 RepID=UPI0039B4527C